MKEVSLFAAVAAMTLCSVAHAQSTVTVYGLLDASVERLTVTGH